jgi:hypothetical protein
LLGGVLEAVWQAAKGRPMAPEALQELQTALRQGALDAQEPEAWRAWSAWRLLDLALACCGSDENMELAEEAAVVAYENVAGPGARNDPQVWKNMLRRPEIYKEVLNQTTVLTRLRGMPALDDESLEAIRRRS